MLFIGEFAALLAAVFWSANSVVLTEATLRIGSVSVNVTRMFFAVILLALTILALGLSIDISLRQHGFLVLSGFLGLVFGDTCLFSSLKAIGARLAMLLMSLAPPIAAVLAYFFLGEVLSAWSVAGITVTIIGVALVILQRSPSAEPDKLKTKGVILGILAAVGQGTGLIFAKFAFNEGGLNSLTASLIRLLSAVVILYIMARIGGRMKNPVRMFKNDPVAFKNVIGAAILGPYLGITASMAAIEYTYVGIASTIMATVPIMMLPIARYYYKETLTWKSIAGAFVAVGGIAILFLT